jgi:hypothetical protein
MNEQKIEQFWRDAKHGDVARVMNREAVEARFRDRIDQEWKPGFLSGWSKIDKSDSIQWAASSGAFWRFCQVYDPPQWWLDKPDPGEGYRLLDPFSDELPIFGDCAYCKINKRWVELKPNFLPVRHPKVWYRRRIEPVNNLEIPNESSELVAIAMQMACEEFGRGDGTFNSANFEHACRQIVGSSCSIDGHVIAFILDGRQDVEALKGGRHYRYLKYASRSYSTQEQQSKSSKAPHGSRSLENIPTGWRLLNDNEDRIASDAFWSIGAKDWVIIDECRVESANRDKWPAIRQVEHCRCMMLMEGCFYRLPGGQGIKVTKQGFELE